MYILKKIFILFLLFNLNYSYKLNKNKNLFLSNDNWNSINKILDNNNNEIIDKCTRKLIYNSYEKYAIKKSCIFKNYHKDLCKNIFTDDLIIYGCIGLNKAVKNYNPKKCGLFTKYADFYINSELYKSIRKLSPIHIDLIGKNNYILEKNLNIKNNDIYVDYYEKWDILRKYLNDFEYKCFTYKYNNDFSKKISNKKVALLMSCSEETVRKGINNSKKIILNNELKLF